MDINFSTALQSLGPGAAFRIANQLRPPSAYLWATLLPEQNRPTYHVESGNMIVRATMAGLVGMDSPYPPGGTVHLSKFLEETAKIAIHVGLPESALRQLQQMLMQLQISGAATNQTIVDEALNFYNKVILQSHIDRFEWMRGQALTTGVLDWTFNGKELAVDYGIPDANTLTARTTGGGDAYGAASSAFWTDVRSARRILRNNLRAAIAHPDTIDEIVTNNANSLEIVNQIGSVFTLQRLKTIGGNTVRSSDVRDRVELIAYDLEGEVLDPNNPGRTIKLPFCPTGKIVYVANNNRSEYRVGEGSTDNPDNDLALGYTHIAPTVEGGGRPGRWGELFTPQDAPWRLEGRAVTNGLPVIEAPEKIVIASTEMSS